MRKNIYIGVDGGGTKCKVMVEDEQGHLLGQGKGGAANIRLSVDTSWDSIFDGLNQALKEAKISLHDKSYAFHIGLGLAGTEIPSDVKAFLNHSHPFDSLMLRSDAYTACLGAHGGRDGDIIIIGTGSIGYHIEKGGHFQVSGWGFPHSDEGSGAWVGLKAIRITLHWLDGRREESPLLKAIFQKFNNDLTKLVTFANASKSTQFAEMAPLVVECANQKDPVALDLMQKAANQIDIINQTLVKRSQNKTLPLSLFGGLAPSVEPFLNESTKSRLVTRKYDATKGAILMIPRK
jgi:glucosamine kinase